MTPGADAGSAQLRGERLRVHVFCRVVDNYGDAGVAWRLARQLAAEHRADATLWIDAAGALARIEPAFDARLDDVRVRGVRVRRVQDATGSEILPHLVVEAFGGGLPEAYLGAMAAQAKPPVWVNLEYLSAEFWIEAAHRLPSPQPRLPLTRYFFFPGFTPATGGLLRERDVFARRDAARHVAREARLPAAVATTVANAGGLHGLVVSLFCYPNGALPALLDVWAEGDERVTCLVPHGVAAPSFDAWLGGTVPRAGEVVVRGALTLVGIPFTSQDDYDRLLWSCDLNFVRGEDSFVRAQLAARPLVWQAYVQAEDAHIVKQAAFVDRYVDGLDVATSVSVRAVHEIWNRQSPGMGPCWFALQEAKTTFDRHAVGWARRITQGADLATKLAEFCQDRLE